MKSPVRYVIWVAIVRPALTLHDNFARPRLSVEIGSQARSASRPSPYWPQPAASGRSVPFAFADRIGGM